MRGHGYVKDSVSAVIVCWNKWELTAACLWSIIQSDDLPDEIVLVDNASTDETAERLSEVNVGGSTLFARVPTQVATLTENVGWGRGANIGAQLAEGEYLLHLNNDTTVHPGWLTALVDEMDDTTAVVAGKLLHPDGSIQHAGTQLFHDSNGTYTAENLTADVPAYDADCVSLAAALCRADAWNQLGGVDPAFRNGYEDVDYCLKARRNGWRLRYTPDSVVTHMAHGSGPERWAHVQDNIRLLHERWG